MTMLDYALAYAARGLYIFPCDERAKEPHQTGGVNPQTGKPYRFQWAKYATNDPKRIRQLWQQWPDANIGLPAKPNHLIVMDVDPEGLETWVNIIAEKSINDQTLTQDTPRGGCHVIYHAPDNIMIGNKDLAPGINVRGVKGDGGYIVVTPSIHPNGLPYKWSYGASPDESAIADLPQPLIDLLTPPPTLQRPIEPSRPIDLPDQELIERAMNAKNGANFARLWGGDISGYPSHSEADEALCGLLAFWWGRDAAAIDRLFRQSGLYRAEKWEREDYRGRTIAFAIEHTTVTYGPDRRNGDHAVAIDEVMSDDTPAIAMSEDAPPIDETVVAAGEASAKKKRSKTPTDDELAQRWLNVHPMTAYGLGDWRRYNAGAWPVFSKDVINREIRDILIGAKKEGVRPSRYVLSSVAEFARLTVSIPDEQWDADHNILVCRNGALEIPTRALLPHDPMHHVTESLPYDFDPNADAPTWHYVLESTIPEAADFVQEFAGYCLTPDTSLETGLWFLGVPGGGRSTIIGGFEATLGNRAGLLGLAAIERSQFALTNLPGKTLVTATEQPNLYIRSAHILNAIISGEPIIVERKYEHPYQITPHAKILWAMNDLPRISEANSGLFRRVKIVHFPPRDEAQQDPTIKDRVRQEAAGILNWALIGLDRLRQRGRFDVPQCVQAATADFRESNDIPAMFVGEMCLTGPDYRTQGSVLYDAYKRWCADTGHKPQSSTSLAEDWRRLEFERYRAAGKTYWRGVGLIDTVATQSHL